MAEPSPQEVSAPGPAVQPEGMHLGYAPGADAPVPAVQPEGMHQGGPAHVGAPWVCKNCGFRNRAANTTCGGFGKLGCKQERMPGSGAGGEGAAEEAPAVEEAPLIPWACHDCNAENEADESLNCTSCKLPRRYQGVLKSVGSDYGFINCMETFRKYQRDVWVSKPILDAAFRKNIATSGINVSFQISLNHDGHPNAKAMKVVKADDESPEDVTFHGTVKYISIEKAYGFIECAEASEQYGSDVHADLQVLGGFCLGQKVGFQVRLGTIGGRPQAVIVTAEGPPPEVTPLSFRDAATQVLRSSWEQGAAEPLGDLSSWLTPARDKRVLVLGDGDLSFAASCAAKHPDCCLDATVYLECCQWHERFDSPEDSERIASLQERGHRVRFGVDATTENCSGCSAIYFNFPNVSVTEAPDAQGGTGLTPSGVLASTFLDNARLSADPGTLLVLGLWGRCDGGADARLYGLDPHALVADRIAFSKTAEGHELQDALEAGFERSGCRADYSFYEIYEDGGYSFRTNMESNCGVKDWHLKGCFVIRVVAK